MNRAVFLDRDGVLNQTVHRMGKARAPYSLEEFVLMPGVPEALGLLKNNGFLLVVVTNQPDVARGWVGREAVEAVNRRLKELVPLDEVKICFHTELDNCTCRKPRAGMLLEAAAERNIDLGFSFMIGDRYTDIAAGRAAGCRTFLVGEGDDADEEIDPDFRVKDLLEAANLIVQL